LALATACVTLFYCLFLFQGYQQLFRDADAGWHIRTGEAILSTGSLPRTDPYSFTRGGQPWFAWEWLSDTAMGAIHRAAGLKGVAFLYAVAIAAGAWLWFRLHWALDGNFLLACSMAPLLLSTCNIHWLARPHVLSWIFLLLTVFPYDRPPGLSSFAKRDSGFGLLLVAAGTVLWANVHASFFMAPVIFLILALDGAVGRAPWPPAGHPSEARTALSSAAWRGQGGLPRQGPWYLKAAAVAALAPLLNPYGPQLYVHVFRYLTDSELLARIGEFQSFDFHSAGAGQILATVVLGMTGGAIALTHRRYAHFVLSVVITAMALRSARALPLAALLLLPIANASLTEYLRGLPSWRSFVKYGENLRAQDRRVQGLALVPVVAAIAWAFMPPGAFPAADFPVAAYSHIPPDARLFAPDKFGGYLIYRSEGRLKVFFDGRSDLYGAEFLKRYSRLVQARPGWQEYWNSFHFTHALLSPDTPLRGALEQAGWRPVYQDKTAILLVFGRT